jgi:hypothetical protein
MSIVSTGTTKPIRYLTRKQQRRRWHDISARTLKRWADDPGDGLATRDRP